MSEVIQEFRTKAEAVSAIVSSVPSLDQALAYTVDLCARKKACQMLVSGCQEDLSQKAEDLCGLRKWGRIIAAPGLARDDLDRLVPMAREQGISVIRRDMRKHLEGVDIGLTICEYGIAETGTLILDSSSEELRLGTMISEIHVAVIPASRIKGRAEEITNDLETLMENNPNYLAFITGASRTADIERVLALGVHGPLELHILILEDR
ncbi:lactate utilization protein [Desulfoplanes formicivorans]|uniref:Lactate utilization protein B/C n=1 Tax=Desulfoplanes formicivorans TaxID=1592317 RepID=A0A194AF32_9BACT|nr:lactate utilization protein [Desulfoplanes formicivorans]GAU07805.1 lactate utilization protein B/C [Desulfoplanes formicivorans]